MITPSYRTGATADNNKRQQHKSKTAMQLSSFTARSGAQLHAAKKKAASAAPRVAGRPQRSRANRLKVRADTAATSLPPAPPSKPDPAAAPVPAAAAAPTKVCVLGEDYHVGASCCTHHVSHIPK